MLRLWLFVSHGHCRAVFVELYTTNNPASAPYADAGPLKQICCNRYIWDTTLNSLLLTLLAPTFFQSMIAAWLSMGIHNHYAVDFVSNRGIGPWYAFNDMMIFRAMDTMARFGDARGPVNYAQALSLIHI